MLKVSSDFHNFNLISEHLDTHRTLELCYLYSLPGFLMADTETEITPRGNFL